MLGHVSAASYIRLLNILDTAASSYYSLCEESYHNERTIHPCGSQVHDFGGKSKLGLHGMICACSLQIKYRNVYVFFLPLLLVSTAYIVHSLF